MEINNNIETGRCQCGKVYYSFPRKKVISAHHCHCKDCQRITGSGKATIVFVSKKNIEIKGDLKYYETKGSSGMNIRRGFCINCGSGVLSYAKELSRIMFIKAGTLDNSDWIKIESNFFAKSASHWSKPDNTIESFKENPGLMKNIKTLLKSF